jgi:hypothetical protein
MRSAYFQGIRVDSFPPACKIADGSMLRTIESMRDSCRDVNSRPRIDMNLGCVRGSDGNNS